MKKFYDRYAFPINVVLAAAFWGTLILLGACTPNV